jgi:hypothetical protein
MQADRVAGDHRDGAAINRQEQRPRRMGVGSGKLSGRGFAEHAQLAALRECHLAKISLQTPRRRLNAAGTPSLDSVAIIRPKTIGPSHRPDRQGCRAICLAVFNGCPSRCADSDWRLTAIESFVFCQFDNLDLVRGGAILTTASTDRPKPCRRRSRPLWPPQQPE